MNLDSLLADIARDADKFLAAVLPQLHSTAFVVLTLLTALFVFFFLLPGIWHGVRFRLLRNRLTSASSQNAITEFDEIFAKHKRLDYLWREYRESLHIQRIERDGKTEIIAVRATGPAEIYFNNQFLVDTRRHTEFFKHLPGIFTGIGIIGTFGGLIQGLQKLDVSDPTKSQTSLKFLMDDVSQAFLISATAITLAIAITFIEKFLLAWLYRLTEQIAHTIDERFVSGVGEEYLSRLVTSSEESASQSRILKDALVSELGDLLRELTEAQIASAREQQGQMVTRLTEAAREDSRNLASAIAEGIQTSLQGPLRDIAEVVKTAAGDQSASAGRMLQDVMTSFSQRLNDLFGGQISGLSDLNKQTAQSMQEAVGTLRTLVSNIEESSRRSTDTMAERMAQAIEKMEARQEAINTQSIAFVEQIKQLTSTSQTETSHKIQATLETIGSQVSDMLEKLTDSQTAAYENNRAREQAMSERTQTAVGAMTDSVDTAIKEIANASSLMAENMQLLTHATNISIDKMNLGAGQISAAADSFASAGQRVASVIDQAALVSARMSETSGALISGATALQELLNDYRAQRDAVGLLMTELRNVVESARKEAALTGDILARIENSAARLGTAQTQADTYLDGVSKVLAEAHQSFADEIKRTLDRANHEFHTKLTSAVQLLSATILELDSTLATAGVKTPVRS
nr:anti-phage ZorAB system protein ZorA [uncultured Dongia sp.]